MAKQLPTIVIDTREQKPYAFAQSVCNTVVGTLATGDYSVRGFEHAIALERKSGDDLVNTLFGRGNRDRFCRELERMQAYERKAILVEADLKSIRAHDYYSKTNPESVIGMMIALSVKYDVSFVLASNRRNAKDFAVRWLIRCALELTKRQEKILECH